MLIGVHCPRSSTAKVAALDPDNPPEKLIVAEGIEDALSAMQIADGIPPSRR
jgi:hypothetical protein